MTHPDPEDVLRRALHEAAESVEPAADGLARIRERLTPPHPLAVAWLMKGWTSLSQFALSRLEPAWSFLADRLPSARAFAIGRLRGLGRADGGLTWLRPALERLNSALGWLRAAARRLRSGRETRAKPGGRPPGLKWLRPALAMAAVVLVAVAGGFALSGLPRSISQLSQFTGPSQTHSGNGSGHQSGLNGSGEPIGPTPGSGHRRQAETSPSPDCPPTSTIARGDTSPGPSPSPSPSPTPSPTPSRTRPIASPAPTLSPTPSPTASPTTSSSSHPSSPRTSQVTNASTTTETADAVVNVSGPASPSPSAGTGAAPAPLGACPPAAS